MTQTTSESLEQVDSLTSNPHFMINLITGEVLLYDKKEFERPNGSLPAWLDPQCTSPVFGLLVDESFYLALQLTTLI